MNRVLISTMIVGLAAGSAWADNYTPINDGADNSEARVYQVLNSLYGVSPTTPNGSNALLFTGSDFTVTRLQDTDGGGIGSAMNVHTTSQASDATDQVWQDGTVPVLARAVYSAANQAFGWYGTINHDLFTASATQTDTPAPTDTGLILTSQDTTLGSFELYDDGFYSKNSHNLATDGGIDHMVTFAVDNSVTHFHGFIVFFEDSAGGDYDYNDLAVQITAVPLPPAAWAGISTLAGVAGIGFIRRRRLNLR